MIPISPNKFSGKFQQDSLKLDVKEPSIFTEISERHTVPSDTFRQSEFSQPQSLRICNSEVLSLRTLASEDEETYLLNGLIT